eukprot:3055273-Amphidinium_carterae.1
MKWLRVPPRPLETATIHAQSVQPTYHPAVAIDTYLLKPLPQQASDRAGSEQARSAHPTCCCLQKASGGQAQAPDEPDWSQHDRRWVHQAVLFP